MKKKKVDTFNVMNFGQLFAQHWQLVIRQCLFTVEILANNVLSTITNNSDDRNKNFSDKFKFLKLFIRFSAIIQLLYLELKLTDKNFNN